MILPLDHDAPVYERYTPLAYVGYRVCAIGCGYTLALSCPYCGRPTGEPLSVARAIELDDAWTNRTKGLVVPEDREDDERERRGAEREEYDRKEQDDRRWPGTED